MVFAIQIRDEEVERSSPNRLFFLIRDHNLVLPQVSVCAHWTWKEGQTHLWADIFVCPVSMRRISILPSAMARL